LDSHIFFNIFSLTNTIQIMVHTISYVYEYAHMCVMQVFAKDIFKSKYFKNKKQMLAYVVSVFCCLISIIIIENL
jgi:cytochrome bd-type quinol oxidase subunit 1